MAEPVCCSLAIVLQLAAATAEEASPIKLFTIVSLVIAISGAAYACIAAIRDGSKRRVDEALDAADINIQTMQANQGFTRETSTAWKAYKNMLFWKSSRLLALGIPLGLFFVAVYALSFQVLGSDFSAQGSCPWSVTTYKAMLWILVISDVLCVGAVVLATVMILRKEDEVAKGTRQSGASQARNALEKEDSPPPADGAAERTDPGDCRPLQGG